MSDDTKIIDQNPGTPQAPTPASAPVGTVNKEMGPVPSAVPEIRPAGPEVKHEISQESAGLGVKEIQDRPDLGKVVDMRHAGPSVPIPSGPTGKITLPMSEDEVTDKLKTGQDDDSGKWLSKLIQKIMKVMGL